MATRTISIVDDDLGDGEAAETIRWGLDGTVYEIDLSEANSRRFRGLLSEFLEASRRVGGKTATAKKTAAKTSKKKDEAPLGLDANGANTTGRSNREIRDWARTAGLDVPARGRIPAEIITAFAEAHQEELADVS